VRAITRKPGICNACPPISMSSAPPTAHSTTMNVIADMTAAEIPKAKSIGASVAMRVSSPMRYSGVLVLALHQVEMIVAALRDPAVERVVGHPLAPEPLRGHAAIDARHRDGRR